MTATLSVTAFGVLTAGVALATQSSGSTANPAPSTSATDSATNFATSNTVATFDDQPANDPTATVPASSYNNSTPAMPSNQFVPPPMSRSRGS